MQIAQCVYCAHYLILQLLNMKMHSGQSLILENPVKRLSQTRAWYRVKRRETYIKPYDLAGMV